MYKKSLKSVVFSSLVFIHSYANAAGPILMDDASVSVISSSSNEDKDNNASNDDELVVKKNKNVF